MTEPGQRGRVEFLDALRGLAALLVAVQHALERLSPRYLRWSIEVWRPGEFGVVLFFICSGFIIPASLERHGSIKRFWIGRFFRLYPLYWFAIAAAFALNRMGGRFPMPDQLSSHPFRLLLGNLSMFQFFLGVPLIIGASWTLGYELIFYLGSSLLMIGGLQKRSWMLAAVTLGAATVAGRMGFLALHPDITTVVAALLLVLFCVGPPQGGLTPRLRWVGFLLAWAVVWLFQLGPHAAYLSFCFFGAMLTGTVFNRYFKGSYSRAQTAGLLLIALASVFAATRQYVPEVWDRQLANAHHTWKPECATFVSAYLVFALALAFGRRRFPQPLTFLGQISYSVYLSHAIVIYAVPAVGPFVVSLLVWMLSIIGCSTATYYLIEKPFHDLGTRLSSKAQLPPSAELRVAA